MTNPEPEPSIDDLIAAARDARQFEIVIALRQYKSREQQAQRAAALAAATTEETPA